MVNKSLFLVSVVILFMLSLAISASATLKDCYATPDGDDCYITQCADTKDPCASVYYCCEPLESVCSENHCCPKGETWQYIQSEGGCFSGTSLENCLTEDLDVGATLAVAQTRFI